jgi:hypothetical protein
MICVCGVLLGGLQRLAVTPDRYMPPLTRYSACGVATDGTIACSVDMCRCAHALNYGPTAVRAFAWRSVRED